MNTHKNIAPTSDDHTLLSCSFNQDQGCFAICHDHGFRVYSTDPMELRVDRRFDDGGIGVAQMLHRTNYLAIVGGGRNPKFSQNKVVIWDDLKQRPALSLEFLSSILNVQLSRTRIVVVLRNKVHIYAFSSPPTRIAGYETVDNPTGIVAMSESMVAFPSRSPGQIQLVSLGEERLVSIIRAHKSPIRCLALNAQGTILASASDTGTIIRLHSTANTALLHELRRGLDRALIYSMSFSSSSHRLAVLSDKNTLHVFDTSQVGGNRKHMLSKVPLLPSYFSSEWSFVSARVEGDRGVVGWSSDDSVVVIWTESRCRWEKYVIVERETSAAGSTAGSPNNVGSSSGFGSGSGGVIENEESTKWELVREAWRGFEGLSND